MVSTVRLDLKNRLRSEEHTSESSHSQISYAVFCLKKKTKTHKPTDSTILLSNYLANCWSRSVTNNFSLVPTTSKAMTWALYCRLEFCAELPSRSEAAA